ncbi:SMC-Scp complex subunit ScpB [Dubosiella muris]|uniref:SMC-Scp complex subunit ScpB n=1 Tax=Dubosiella muris TaxID=3038133 RepID=A0AC61R7T8_9FIRM|nr:SMC-Scp complex subunit ScpB [Dubosiella muris]TGY66312.1 SMC-Scp complex subunit ScpB [Dubosiella muris]
MNSRKAIVEGLIFMAGEEGLSLLQLQSLLQEVSRTELLALLETIKEEYSHDAKGIELVEYASRYKFVTKEFVYPYGEKLFEQFKKATLSQAAMETLAIIAYRQPITRVEIEEIRGVSCDVMLKKLQLRGLIEAKDRLDVVGKPLLYQVTGEFLDAFELETLAELPELETKEVQEELFVQNKEEQ